ncbi:AI-2E family transporter [Rhizobacter sp. Root404]|uniref:AI-2E family transporter n=1 Tax=Rhizobacter sp. Root404 TaxID=1736528 RepID=UPI0006F3417D|nr:AI-2E family transporter [Rhizobacter sp. Root404]KQW37030.1 ABC transporter permease [Rhizobacter sp. Root404]
MTLTPAQRHTVTWIALSLIAGLIVWLLGPVLTPFLVAAVLAYVLHPLVERLARRRVPRVLAVTVVEVVAIVLVLAVMLLIVPILSKQLPLLREQIPLLAERMNTQLGPWLARFGIDVALDTASIKAFALKYLDANVEDWLATALSSARIGGSILIAIIGNVVLVPMVLFYLLLDWNNLMQRAGNLIPPRLRSRTHAFFDDCDATLGQYLRGQLLVMLSLAVFYSVGLSLFGFDLAVPVGVFTGLAAFIPYVGFGLGLTLALISAVLQFTGWYGLIGVAVVFGAGQLLENFVLVPRLVGERIGMSALTVIFALLAFGHLFGFVGVLIALPVSSVLVVAVRRLRAAYVESELYQG